MPLYRHWSGDVPGVNRDTRATRPITFPGRCNGSGACRTASRCSVSRSVLGPICGRISQPSQQRSSTTTTGRGYAGRSAHLVRHGRASRSTRCRAMLSPFGSGRDSLCRCQGTLRHDSASVLDSFPGAVPLRKLGVLLIKALQFHWLRKTSYR
jgi:hypothetical protein